MVAPARVDQKGLCHLSSTSLLFHILPSRLDVRLLHRILHHVTSDLVPSLRALPLCLSVARVVAYVVCYLSRDIPITTLWQPAFC